MHKYCVKKKSNFNVKIPVLKRLTEKTVTLLILSTAHRVQTISCIKISNICISDNSLDIKIPELIKTSGPGRYQPILCIPKFNDNLDICVYSCMIEYLNVTKEIRNNADNLFIAINKPHKAVGPQTISRWVKNILEKAGIDTSIFTAHSTRHAATSKAFQKGVDLGKIRKTAGWSNNSNVFANFYNRPILDNNYLFAEKIINA